jgi:hypothetical protein|tara:strand:- start:669 stop:1001 length:333 start_codon:yes stop_codon:yes gene_type:complete
MTGVKYDQDKPDYSLLPYGALEQVVQVLTYGAKKYDRHNWENVPDLTNRYTAAAFRHIVAYSRGELNDDETGLSHLAHATCCLMFMCQNDININMDMDAEITQLGILNER